MSDLLLRLNSKATDIHKLAEMTKSAEEIFIGAVCDELDKLGCDEHTKEAVFKGLVSFGKGLIKKVLPGSAVSKASRFAAATARNKKLGALGSSRVASGIRQGTFKGTAELAKKAPVVKADPFLRSR